MIGRVLSATQNAFLGQAIMSVRQKRAQQHEQAVQAQQQEREAQMQVQAGKAAGSVKPKSKAAPKGKTKVPASTITPYLTSSDLMQASDAQALAENTENDATLGLITSAADAKVRSGDLERSRVRGVSGANNDAAARGLENSGIRAGNVGMVNASAARGQSQLNNDLAMAGAATNTKVMAARNQLARSMQAMVARAAENGAALPVDPYSNGPGRGANVPGTVTKRKRRVK